MSIRFKLLAWFGLFAGSTFAAFIALWFYGIPVLGIEGMMSNQYKRSIYAVETLANKEQEHFELWFSERRREMKLLSLNESITKSVAHQSKQNSVSLKESNETQSIRRQLNTILEFSQGSYDHVYIVNPTSKKIVSFASAGQPITQWPIAHQKLFEDATEPGFTELVRMTQEGSHTSLLLCNQITEMDDRGLPTGKIVGLLIAQLNLELPLKLNESAMKQTLGSTGTVALTNHKGQIILNAMSTTLDEHILAAAHIVSGTEGSKKIEGPSNSEWIVAFRHLHLGSSDSLSIAVIGDTKEALSSISDMFIRIIAIMAILFTLTLWLILTATKMLTTAERQIRQLNLHLEDRIRIRTKELEETNVNLTQTLANLDRTRAELVRTEKLAALGSLVAGISHEINTPLGNSLVVASTMQDNVSEFKNAVKKGLTRHQLDAFIAQSQEGTDILMSSLKQANELISSFKQVSVDQTSSNKRQFKLKEMVMGLLITLGPSIRKTNHQIEVNIDAELELNSYPGPLGQVITNIVNNAQIHAFEHKEHGLITITAMQDNDNMICLKIIDNGEGIPPEHMDLIFDPFFTTKFGKGGSGLGLNIVYNIVKNNLNGDIQVESSENGTIFTILCPKSIDTK